MIPSKSNPLSIESSNYPRRSAIGKLKQKCLKNDYFFWKPLSKDGSKDYSGLGTE
jgi:hypothetical protein